MHKIGFGLALIVFLLSGRGAYAQSDLECGALPGLIGMYLHNHVSHNSLSNDIRGRAAESYLSRIDPSRTILQRQEADVIAEEIKATFEDLNGKKCTRIDGIRNKMVGYYKRMETDVRAMLAPKDFAIDKSVELALDPDKRGFPTNSKQRYEILRAFVHFQMATLVAAGTDVTEAKKNLVHRYELLTRRATEESTDDLYATFLDAFAAALDPHSAYLSGDDLEDFRISMTLSLEGIGAELSSRDGYTIVERILAGGAAERNGVLEPKDKIVAVGQATGDMVNVIDMRLRDVVRMIRGKKGTAVRLTVLRSGEGTQRLTVTITRDKINLEEQAASLRFETIARNSKKLKLAILDLPSFYGDSNPMARQADTDVKRLLAEARDANADGLVLDMSHNGGGILEQAVSIAGLFIWAGDVVAVRDSRDQTETLPDPTPGVSFNGPLVVLTSRMSASGAEIVAGALKDYHRGLIAGDARTFGKGSVQTMVPLPAGLGALKTTIGLYFLPGGRSTQHSGVSADILIPSVSDTDEIGESSEPFALPTQTISPFLGDRANTDIPSSAWRPLNPAMIAQLAKKSAKRVGRNKELQEEKRRLAELEKNRGKVNLAELLREQKDAEQRAVDRRDRNRDDKKLSPQLREALEILADLVITSPNPK